MLRALRQRYRNVRRLASLWRAALSEEGPAGGIMLREATRAPGRVEPITGQTAERARAAVNWLIRAQDASDDDGVSYGYFPFRGGWDVSYPETTGYIITSLIRYGRKAGRPELIERAHRMAAWEASIQMENGAVQGGKLTTADRRTAAAFNTGMVLDGLVSSLALRDDEIVRDAAERAADFLVADQDSRGLFRTNGAFVSNDPVKVYSVLCAWAMYRMGELTDRSSYRDAALRAVEAVLMFQHDNGWFDENDLEDKRRPLTHTIGYTAQGILEVGVASGREDFVAASERCMRGVMSTVGENGYLPGRLNNEWAPEVRWVCLTGSAQVAIVLYRLFEVVGHGAFRTKADLLVDFVKATQLLDTGEPGHDGAIAGSYPFTGPYIAAGYPNWATKYYLDALMLQAESSGVSLT